MPNLIQGLPATGRAQTRLGAAARGARGACSPAAAPRVPGAQGSRPALPPADHRGCQRVQIWLALAHRLGDPRCPHRLELGRQCGPVGDRALGVSHQFAFCTHAAIGYAERQHHLPGGGGVGHARPAHPRHAHHARRRRHEVDRDRLATPRHRQGRGLAGLLDEPRQPRPRALAHVQLAEHPVRQRHQLQPQPVGPVRGALDQASVLERRQQPRRRARIDPDSPRQFVDPEAGVAARHLVEQRERARHRGHPLPGSRAHVRRWRGPPPSRAFREPRTFAIGVGRVDSNERVTVTSRPPGANRSRE